MKSSNVTHVQSGDKDEIFFVSEHTVETVTNKIYNFKEANEKNTYVYHKGSITLLTMDVNL
jgi:hypothetical protein